MEISKKWTIRNFFSVEEAKEILGDSAKKRLALVAGITNQATVGTSNYGDFIKLLGNFQANNLVNGEIIRTSAVILPDVAANLIYGQLQKGAEAVEFAFFIGIKESDTPTGYEYYAEPAIEAAESDPLAALLQKVNLPALTDMSGDKSSKEASAKEKQSAKKKNS